MLCLTFEEGAFDTANELAILAGARKPAWEDQPATTVAASLGSLTSPLRPPSSASDGVALAGQLIAKVHVPIRASAYRRRGVVTFSVFDAASTYTVTLGGVAYSAATPANLAAGLTALASAIDAAASYTASVVGSTVVFYGMLDTDFSIVPSVSGGTGTIAVVADPSSATLRFWGWADAATGTTATETWSAVLGPTGAPTLTADYMGVLGDVEVNGLSRLYVEVDSLAGHASDANGTAGTLTYTTPTVRIGPCGLENT